LAVYSTFLNLGIEENDAHEVQTKMRYGPRKSAQNAEIKPNPVNPVDPVYKNSVAACASNPRESLFPLEGFFHVDHLFCALSTLSRPFFTIFPFLSFFCDFLAFFRSFSRFFAIFWHFLAFFGDFL